MASTPFGLTICACTETVTCVMVSFLISIAATGNLQEQQQSYDNAKATSKAVLLTATVGAAGMCDKCHDTSFPAALMGGCLASIMMVLIRLECYAAYLMPLS